jgi:uncharacterized membrane protein YcaP (DUF421 family)
VTLWQHVFGSTIAPLTWWQMVGRSLLIFGYLLALLRLAGVRPFSQSSPLNIVVSVVLGSVLSRALTGNAPLGPALAAAATLVAAHKLAAALAQRNPRFEWSVKGYETRLIRDGQLLADAMTRKHVTERDIMEALRSSTQLDELSRVEAAYLERSGRISFVLNSRAHAS